MEVFRMSKDFSQEKCDFSQEAFNTRLDICHRRVVACFLELDLSYLEEKEEKEEGAKGVVGDGAPPSIETIKGCSEATPRLEVVPAFIPAEAMPILLL